MVPALIVSSIQMILGIDMHRIHELDTAIFRFRKISNFSFLEVYIILDLAKNLIF
jgi:hypothetical protein